MPDKLQTVEGLDKAKEAELVEKGAVVVLEDGDFYLKDDVESERQSEVDPWDVLPGADNSTPWSELSNWRRVLRVLWILFRFLCVLALLYSFVCSLDVLQDSFQLAGGRKAGAIFTNSVIINNPVSALMIGVLVTVLVQSSSTSTSIVVSMVAAGILEVRQSIPIIMGANIGTTVTAVIVSVTQSGDRMTFRRAFSGATVHDSFNWLTAIILLPVEVLTGYLYHLTDLLVKGIQPPKDSENPQFLKVITTPLTKQIVQIDKKVINAIALESDRQKFPLARYYCKEVADKYNVLLNDGMNDSLIEETHAKTFTYNVAVINGSEAEQYNLSWSEVLDINSTKCHHLLVGTGLEGHLSETAAGAILMVVALLSLIICLVLLVKILNSLMRGTMAIAVRKMINAEFPGKFAFLTGYLAILVGAGITVLVQSSSVFTSTMTPLVGIGIVTVERVFPLTLGSNIGTTITSMLAALTAEPDAIHDTMQISLCHLFFNITGILIFYPIPFMRRIPIGIAKFLGKVVSEYRWFAIFYIILMFLIVPLVVFGLSMAGSYVLLGVGVPVLVLILLIIVINIIQNKRPSCLPAWLQTWHFLPEPMRSLDPYDRVLMSCCCCNKEGKRCCCLKSSVNPASVVVSLDTSQMSEQSSRSDQKEKEDSTSDLAQESSFAYDNEGRIEDEQVATSIQL